MTATKERTELVEVMLHFELPVYIPSVGSNGELTYKKTDVAPENGLKVKVPAYAAENKRALGDFLFLDYQDNDCDVVSPEHANIWVDDENHEYGGEFKFNWSSGRYD